MLIASRLFDQRLWFAGYLFAFLYPLGAGTGLLTAARRGRFDLLIGAGATRSQVWSGAMVFGLGIPALLTTAVFILSSPSIDSSLYRLPAILLLTGGVAFSAGLVELRYLAGAIWLLTRLFLVLLPPGLAAAAQLERGVRPSAGMLTLIILAAPEIMLSPHVPVVYALFGALTGLCSVLGSWFWFCKADFAGKAT